MTESDPQEHYKESFGGCTYASKSPVHIAEGTKAVNLKLSFEEALKLNVALSACVQHLTRQDRSTPEKRRKGVKLIIHLDERRRLRVQLGNGTPPIFLTPSLGVMMILEVSDGKANIYSGVQA